MQIFFDKVQSIFVEPEDGIQHVKMCIEGKTRVPAGIQRLIYRGKELNEHQTVIDCGLEAGSTLHLVLRLRGGKGGFGSLLRSAGRAALTDNFDACRDLSGRRMRHVNADKKLADWAAQARERELEKVAAKHARDQERAALQEAEQQVDLDDVKVAQDAALANVMSAVESALASVPGKRKPDAALPPARRQKAPRHMSGLDGDLSSDSDEELEQDIDAGAAGADMSAVRPKGSVDLRESAAKAGRASGSSGSEQEALERPLRTAHSVLEKARSVEDSTAPPSQMTGASAAGLTGVGSNLQTAEDSTELTVVASTAAAPEMLQATAGPASDSQAASALKETSWEPVDLQEYKSAKELEVLGLDHLKAELQRHGLKVGGSLSERAARLYLLSHTPIGKIDKKHLAKPAKK